MQIQTGKVYKFKYSGGSKQLPVRLAYVLAKETNITCCWDLDRGHYRNFNTKGMSDLAEVEAEVIKVSNLPARMNIAPLEEEYRNNGYTVFTIPPHDLLLFVRDDRQPDEDPALVLQYSDILGSVVANVERDGTATVKYFNADGSLQREKDAVLAKPEEVYAFIFGAYPY